MAVRVARGVLAAIRSSPEMIALEVRGADDGEAARRALEQACDDMCTLDAGWDPDSGLAPGDENTPKWVSDVMPTGAGVMVLVDGGEVPYRFLRRIPDMIVRRLAEEGVHDAVVGVPEASRLPYPEEIARAVALRVFPPPEPGLPFRGLALQGWLAPAVEWLRSIDTERIWGSVAGTSFLLPAAEVPAYLERCRAVGSDTQLWAGDPGRRIRMVGAAFWNYQNLVLAAGGPATSDADLEAILEELKVIGRALAPDAAQAFIDINPTFDFARGTTAPITRDDAQPLSIEPLCDELAFDAFAWQLLGPGHLARLESIPPGAQRSDDDRVELTLGHVEDWLHLTDEDPFDYYRTPPIRIKGRQLLEPLLLPSSVAIGIEAQRYRIGGYRDHGDD